MADSTSKFNIEFTADTSKLGSKFEQYNRLIEQSQKALERLDAAGNKQIVDRRALSGIENLKNDLQELQKSMEKINNTQVSPKTGSQRSKRNRNAERNQNLSTDTTFSRQMAQQLSDNINNIIEQAVKSSSNYMSSGHIIANQRNMRGRSTTNSTYEEDYAGRAANRRGVSYTQESRGRNSQTKNLINQANRSINAINDTGGRITYQARKSYDRKMDTIGDELGGFDEMGVSEKRRRLDAQRKEFMATGQSLTERNQELGSKGTLTAAEKNEQGMIQNEIANNNKLVDSIKSEIDMTAELERTFRKLKSAESDIKEVTPSRRSAFTTYAMVGAVRGMSTNGQQILAAQQADTRAISASSGQYNSYQVRKQAESAGLPYGISGSEMLANESAFIQGAGNNGEADRTLAGERTGILSRLTGATAEDSRSLTSSYAQNVNGASGQGLQQFQQVFEGAMSKSDMTKYGASQVKALDTLISTVARNNGGSLSQAQAEDLARTQGQLASSGDKALMGQNGANTLSQVDSSIRNGMSDPLLRSQFLMSDPQKFGNGIQGWAEQTEQMQKGATSENLQTLFNSKTGILGQVDDKTKEVLIGNSLGLTGEKAGKLNDALTKNGGKQLSKKQMKDIGVTYEDGQYKEYSDSSDGKNDRNTASTEQASARLGQWSQAIKTNIAMTLQADSSLALFNVAIRAATTSLEAVAPIKGGRMVASGIAKANSGNRYSDMRQTDANGNRTSFLASAAAGEAAGAGSWRQRATNSLENGGGKLGSKIRSTSLGGSLVTGATSVVNSSAVAKGANMYSKASGVAGRVSGRIMSNPVVQGASRLANGASNVVGTVAGKALPFIPAALEAGQAVSDKQNRGAHVGGAVGSVAGTIAGGLTGNPLIAMAAGMGGQWLGSKVGGLFDNQSKRKDDQADTTKKLSVETKREKNIKKDSALTDRQLRLADKKGSKNKDKDGNGDRETTTSSSPYSSELEDNNKADDDKKQTAKEKAKAKAKAKKASASGSNGGTTLKMAVSGTINHTGNVADASQLQAQTNMALNSLLTNPNANEVTRA